jgi:hypothetical protein
MHQLVLQSKHGCDAISFDNKKQIEATLPFLILHEYDQEHNYADGFKNCLQDDKRQRK